MVFSKTKPDGMRKGRTNVKHEKRQKFQKKENYTGSIYYTLYISVFQKN